MRPKIGHFSWFSGENCSIFLRSRLRRSRTYLFLGREARSKVTHSWKRAFGMIWDNKIEKPGYPSAAVDVGEQLGTEFFSTISMQTAQVFSACAFSDRECLSFFVFIAPPNFSFLVFLGEKSTFLSLTTSVREPPHHPHFLSLCGR